MKGLAILILSLFSINCFAAVEYREFHSVKQEQSYESLIKELRCLVCQNQTIADSNADLAKDLRRQVYEMLQQGKSRTEIVDFLVQRYGDFVIYNPPFKAKTSILWLAPVLFLLLGFVSLFVMIKRKRTALKNGTGPDQGDLEKVKKIKALLGDGEKL